MRVPLDKLLEKLGVGHVLKPYETQPWLHYDEAQGITCSAEVRMAPGGDMVEAELQFLYDAPPADAPAPATEEEVFDYAAYAHEYDKDINKLRAEKKPLPQPTYGSVPGGGPRQITLLRAQPVDASGAWSTVDMRLQGQSFNNKIYNWEEKACDFFRSCVQALQMGDLPDIDMLIDQELSDDDDGGGGRRGRVGRKAPKIKPAQLLGIKKGM